MYDVEKKKTTTALAEHATMEKQSFNFDDAKILCREWYKQRLRIQEVHQIIRHEENVCNFKTDSAYINPIYYSLIKATNDSCAFTEVT